MDIDFQSGIVAAMPTTGARRVTINDVAAAARVQPSTVSKALHAGRGSAEVRRRVAEAAARLGYRPNERARGLRRAQSRSIGVLVPDLANPTYLPFLRGVERAARERDYAVLIADGQRSPDAERVALERFFDQGVDGLLLAGAVDAKSLQLFVDHGVPTAPALTAGERRVARHWERGEAAATHAMAERLLDLGHRSFVFVAPAGGGTRSLRRYARSRFGALRSRLADARAELTVATVDPAVGYDDAVASLAEELSRLTATAFIGGSQLVAPWLLAALDRAGRRVPHDASLVVYGDSDWARACGVSVIAYDTYAEGRELATALLDRLAGAAAPAAERRAIAATFVERDSLGPAGR